MWILWKLMRFIIENPRFDVAALNATCTCTLTDSQFIDTAMCATNSYDVGWFGRCNVRPAMHSIHFGLSWITDTHTSCSTLNPNRKRPDQATARRRCSCHWFSAVIHVRQGNGGDRYSSSLVRAILLLHRFLLRFFFFTLSLLVVNDFASWLSASRQASSRHFYLSSISCSSTSNNNNYHLHQQLGWQAKGRFSTTAAIHGDT